MLHSGAVEAAFEELAARYGRKVYRLCCSMLRDAELAADTAQDSLLRIWKALPRYDQRASLSTWIYTVTRNRCLTAIDRRRDLDSLSDPAVAQLAESVQLRGAADPRHRPEVLRGLVDALPEQYRRALTLYYYEDRSVGEVASMLGMPEGTVKTHLHRARASLLERIRAMGGGDPRDWLEGIA